MPQVPPKRPCHAVLCYAVLQLPVAVLGDVVVSLDTAARQAAERQYSLRDECRILLEHGVLHLFGYDHELGRWLGAGGAACVRRLNRLTAARQGHGQRFARYVCMHGMLLVHA